MKGEEPRGTGSVSQQSGVAGPGGEAAPPKEFVKDFYQHDLKNLLAVAGLEQERKQQERDNPEFMAGWGVVSKWSEESRYREWDETNARAMVESVADATNGVLPWIQKFW